MEMAARLQLILDLSSIQMPGRSVNTRLEFHPNAGQVEANYALLAEYLATFAKEIPLFRCHQERSMAQ